MKANVGSYDAAVRFVAGCALLVFANHGHIWGLAGFAVAASAVGFCPLYWLLRIDTTCCRHERRPAAVPPEDEPLVRPSRSARSRDHSSY